MGLQQENSFKSVISLFTTTGIFPQRALFTFSNGELLYNLGYIFVIVFPSEIERCSTLPVPNTRVSAILQQQPCNINLPAESCYV
jgi:hypothetical protein